MIIHLTTVHPRNDVRIQGKEIDSLNAAHDLVLLVADGRGDSCEEGITIYDLGLPAKNRFFRILSAPFAALRRVLKLRPAMIHFHDPELLPVGMILRVLGYRVVYDVHEDVPRQVLDKFWLPVAVRLPVSLVMSALEWLAGHVFTAIVAATPTIAARFPKDKTVTVQNFPRIEEFAPGELPHSGRPCHFIYTGALARIRGAVEMVSAASYASDKALRLQFAGSFRPDVLRNELAALPGWAKVDFHGWLPRPEVAELLKQSRAGLVVLHPTRSYLDSLPIKMFEYMVAGLPVIASDFPLWRQIIIDAECGLLVDPLDSQGIADAMQWIADNPGEAQRMGENGRQAALTHYNWDSEAQKLMELYSRLMS